MLFRNTKTGNILSVHDELTVRLMERSAIYARVEKAPAKAPKTPKAEKEPAKKPTTRKKAAEKAG